MGHEQTSFFEIVFPDTDFNQIGNTQVLCPFPHTIDGVEYFESNPSAGIDLEKGVFHCFQCNRGYSEIAFAAEILKTSYENASEIVNLIKTSDHILEWNHMTNSLWQSQKAMEMLLNLKFSKKAVSDLKIGFDGIGLVFPIIMFDRLLDKVSYRPNQKPKYIRTTNSKSGLIFGYDLWKQSDKPTLICAGEKDATIARSFGFNAISFTGGEQSIPHIFLNEMKNKTIYIVYDNDDAGRKGSKKLAMYLYPLTSKLHIVDLSETCTINGEDLWDYFIKYQKTSKDLIEILKNTTEFNEEDYKEERNITFPMVSLHEATQSKYIGRLIRSNIQVVASLDSIFSTPTMITAHKFKIGVSEDKNTYPLNYKKTWTLNDSNIKDLFYLIDSKLKEKEIKAYTKTNLLKIPAKEEFINLKENAKQSVYKAIVSDIFESDTSSPMTEFTAYSLSFKLEPGKKYLITYRLIPHPQDGQKLVMVIQDVEESDDFLNNFKITPEVINSLSKFQVKPMQNLKEKFNNTVQRVKGLINADYDDLLITVIDLWYHSVQKFNIGKFKNIRGMIDALVVTESRMGKSTTVAALKQTYNLGKIQSLAGNSATIAGLIGGSNKVAGGYQTKAGLIPQNHKGAIVFEELQKNMNGFVKELTDIRTSQIVRISRVNGHIELPAEVRMLSLSNPKAVNGVTRPIVSYPNGVEVLIDLIGNAEDIARYDMIALFGYASDKPIDPFFEPLEAYSDEDYQTRIRWGWSRAPDQIIISKDIYTYVTQKANEINKTFDSYIKIFGIEAWQKIMRLALSIAVYVVSTDETYENLIVKTPHIDLAIEILLALYDNPVFKFREFVEEERKLKEIDEVGIKILQDIYKRTPLLLNALEKFGENSRQNLITMSGMQNEDFSKIMHLLSNEMFIRITGFSISPTERFRKGMAKIDKTIKVPVASELVIRMDDK